MPFTGFLAKLLVQFKWIFSNQLTGMINTDHVEITRYGFPNIWKLIKP